MRHSILGCLAAGLLVGPATASAGLLGQEFTAGYYFPDSNTQYAFGNFTPATFTVGAGIETNGDVEGVTFLPVDFTDTSLTVVLNTILSSPTWNVVPFNGVIFTATLPHGIASASVDPATTMVGFDYARLSFDANRILLNWNGLSYVDGQQVRVNFTFGPDVVPEPALVTLLALGLVAVGATRRRRG